jgi:hypothetical protein
MHATAWRRYLVWMFGSALLAVALCAAVNVLIDPLGILGTPRLRGVNAVKPYLDHHRELSRWQAARRACAKAGIFGNSRAEIGFDPEHPAFARAGLDAFNHAIPGKGVDMARRQLDWLTAIGCAPHLTVLGVEFFDFLGGDEPAPETVDMAAPRIDGTVLAETVFSISALRDSIATVLAQHTARPATITPRGFNPLLNYGDEVAQSGHHTLFRQRAQENLRVWMRKPARVLTTSGGASAHQLALEAFLRQAVATSGEVHVVIYPYHAQIRLMLARAGLSSLFSDWKASLVDTANRLSTDKVRIHVWDFSGLSAETQEAIPQPGDRATAMLGFWEAGHFKKALGDRMLDQMLGRAPGFGIRLQPATAPAWLQLDRHRVRELLEGPTSDHDILRLRAEVDRLFTR